MKVLSIDVGIKNMGLCLFDNVDHDKFVINEWVVINLMESEIPKCSFQEKENPCERIAKYHKKNNYYCMKHSKETTYQKPIAELNPVFVKKQTLKTLYEIAGKYNVDYNKPIKKDALCDTIIKWTSEICLESISQKNAKDENLINLGTAMKRKLNRLLNGTKIDCVLIENQISPIASRMKTLQGMIAQYFIMQYENISIRFVSSLNKLKHLHNEKTKMSYPERKKESIKECHDFLINNKSSFQSFFENHKKKDDLADCMLQGLWYLKQL
jgi:hypothetical protein|tara:strand:- start:2617 stop:3423 length:807 start_codon:yes stop_codon:yes gene_type:complete